jgi:ribosomal protein S18 acetylase RimI-like enzyme
LNPTIRIAQPHDLGELVDVLARSFPVRSPLLRWLAPVLRMGMVEDIRQRLRAPLTANYAFFVATVPLGSLPSSSTRASRSQGVRSTGHRGPQPHSQKRPPREAVVGTVEVALRSTYPMPLSNPSFPYLSNLAVHPDYRRLGIAGKLLCASEEMAASRGFPEVYLHVLDDNTAARRLYGQLGYQVQDTTPLWYCWLFRRPRRLLLRKRLR